MLNYYTPTDIVNVLTCMASWEKSGFKPSLTKRKAIIKRKTSKYNKYMKWHIEQFVDGQLLSSEFVKTKPEALGKLSAPCRPTLCGDKRVLFHTVEIVNG